MVFAYMQGFVCNDTGILLVWIQVLTFSIQNQNALRGEIPGKNGLSGIPTRNHLRCAVEMNFAEAL